MTRYGITFPFSILYCSSIISASLSPVHPILEGFPASYGVRLCFELIPTTAPTGWNVLVKHRCFWQSYFHFLLKAISLSEHNNVINRFDFMYNVYRVKSVSCIRSIEIHGWQFETLSAGRHLVRRNGYAEHAKGSRRSGHKLTISSIFVCA